MKKILAFILIFLLTLCPVAILSSTAAGDYMVEDGVLLSFTGLTTTVKIPDNVYYIADGAFKDNTRINKLVLHSGVQVIGNEAFYGCTSLNEVSGGEGISYVGAYAFHGTPFYEHNSNELITLGSVLLGGTPEGSLSVSKSIGMVAPYAFAENSSITSFTAGDALSIIGEGAFYRCSGLSEVNVTESLSDVGALAFYGTDFIGKSTEDFVTIGDGILLEYKGENKSVVVPDNVKQVSGGAFYFNTGITDVTLPEGVVSVGERAFMNCTKLSSVNLPESLVMIGKEAFAKCKALKTVSVPENTELMGESVFYGCSSLESAELKASGDLPKGIFAKCSSLKLVKLREGISEVGDSAFLECLALTEVALPDSVAVIGNDAFKGALNVTVSCNAGSYTQTYCEANGIKSIQCGDSNMDGKVNIRDATYIQKHVASVLEMSDSETVRADVNFDGKINVRDATHIQKLLAGMI